MANHFGNSSEFTYAQYSSKDAQLNIVMDYVEGWRTQEHRGSYDSYAQVQFYGPVKEGFAPSFVVTVEHSSKVSFVPHNIGGLADDITKKRMLFENAQVVSRSDTQLVGNPAIDLIMTYDQLDQLRNIDAKMILFKERISIFQKDDKFYTIRYLNPQLVYDEFEPAFIHCLGTLRIKE